MIMRSAAVLALSCLLASGAQPGAQIHYQVTGVDGKLTRQTPGGGEERLAAGSSLEGGDVLATGWFSAADLAAPAFGARFHLGSRTRVRLASEAPGVLLELEKGRLRALFDRITGAAPPERRVATPAAILAVRGTEYGVSVDRSGDTTLVVFAGVVEVTDRQGRGSPVRVEAGYALHLRRGRLPGAPYRHGLTVHDWDRGAMPGPPSGAPGMGGAREPSSRGPRSHPSPSPPHGGRPPAGP